MAGHLTMPWGGPSRPAMRCRSVDLPEPDGPTSATRAPSCSSQSTGWRATVAARPLPYVRAAPARPRSGSSATADDLPALQPQLAVARAGDEAAVRRDEHGRAGRGAL